MEDVEQNILLTDAISNSRATLPFTLLCSVYWMVVTGTTIGFGDLGPTHAITRCICVIYIPLAVAVLGEFLGRVAAAHIDRRNDEVEDQFLDRTMTMADLRKMDTDNDGQVSQHEFLSYMLVSLQKVEQEDIDDIMELFKELDRSKTGHINKDDLMKQFRLSVKPGVEVRANSGGLEVRHEEE